MKKRTHIVITFFACIVFISFKNYDVLSNGAPIGSSGAPGDNTCAKSGCHSDNQLNSGNGSMSIEVEGITNEYVAGEEYTVKVKCTSANDVR